MNRSWHPTLASIACSLCFLCVSGLSTAADPTPVTTNPNAVAISRIEMTPTATSVTYHLDVKDAQLPTLLEFNSTIPIDLDGIVSQLLSQKERIGFTQIKIVPGASDKPDSVRPHVIEFTLPKTTDIIISDISFSAHPQYNVVATKAATKITCDLLLTNKSPYSLTNTKFSFLGGGIVRPEVSVVLQPDGQIPFPAKFVVKESSTPVDDLHEKILPLAYWADDTDFDDNKAKAVLQFPMKGNWPKSLKLPGWIHYRYESWDLPDFHFATTLSKAEQLSAYKKHIGEESISFAGATLPVDMLSQFGPVDLKSVVKNAISGTDNWPQIDYTEFTIFSLTNKSDKPVWIRVKGEPKEITYDSNANPKNPLVYSKQLESTSLVTLPGNETGDDLLDQYNLLNNLTVRGNTDGNTMKLQIQPFVDSLGGVAQLRRSQDFRIKDLTKHHNDLVQNGAATDVQDSSRAKLDSAKRVAEALVESYNAKVLSLSGLTSPE